MESQNRRKAPARKRKDDLLRDLFGEENPDMPSPQDRWINIQAVVREVYKDLGRRYGFIDKRWTEITPRWKVDLGHEVLSRLQEPDRTVLEYRPDVVERLLKDHVSNRGDWKKEKARKMVQAHSHSQERASPPSHTSPRTRELEADGSVSPHDERMTYEFGPTTNDPQTSLPPLSSFVEGVERLRGRTPGRYVYREPHASPSASYRY